MASDRSDLKPIKLLIAPLIICTRTGLSSFSGPNTGLSPSRYSAILQIQHWAFQIDETCYEVTSVEDDVHPGHRVFRLNITSAAHWWAARRRAGVQVEAWIVGQTRMSEPELRREAQYIWQSYHQSGYTVHERNCQSFCYLFEQRISVASADPLGADGTGHVSRKMPEPVSHTLAEVSRNVLALGPPFATHLVLGTVPIITSYIGPSIPGKAIVGTKLAVSGKATAAAAAGTTHATLCGVGTAHAIAFGSGVATVGKGVAVVHPLVGAAAVGVGAACIKLAKKRDKRWLKKHGRESLPSI